MNKPIILICKRVTFHSMKDEDAFFEWLKKIKCIKDFKGLGYELHVYISSKRVLHNDLLELISLFYRYKIDMKQLQIFLNKSNEEWFYGEPKGYWHKKVFGN